MNGSNNAQPPLKIEDLTIRYIRRNEPSLKNVSLTLQAGQVMLVAGSSGSGKTTLMRAVNGLIPRTYRAEISGLVCIFGQPVSALEMPELSQMVGTLLQDPERQIVGSHVQNEVAFGLENLGLPRNEIFERTDKVLDYLGILHLRDRETFQLSGGEKQKVALAGVLAMRPKILLLDEPLASLDPASAREALDLFRRLADDGIAVMLVEHRVEDVLTIHPEQVIYLDEGEVVYSGDSLGVMNVVDFSRIKLPAPVILERARREDRIADDLETALPARNHTRLIEFRDVSFSYKADLPEILHDIDFQVCRGDVIAVLGHNGAGKTTLVKHALGLLKPTRGNVLLEGRDTRSITVAQAAHTVGYVFQSPTQMLFAQTVEEELAFGPKNLGHRPNEIDHDVQWAIRTVNLEAELKTPPLALSFGQQKRISIAAVLAMRSRILMMDEPTAGQDYWNYKAFMDAILQMPGFDAILFITHDVDLAVIYANRVILMNDGRIMADGTPQEVLSQKELLRASRVLPTSLLDLNLEHFPQTGRFLRAEALARYA
ncbi:MAG TPA: ABC transporter ATP-binding protein [Anaerolineaceae bacterium]|nr:ABC transporter ATP-binding protein [Anaerolineaceae bacterium]